MTEITNEDLRLIYYYLNDYDEVERLDVWEEKKDAVLSKFPELRIYLDLKRTADIMKERALQDIRDSITD